MPCRKCGRPIYYNYKGPVAGLCGRCTDGSRTSARVLKSKRIGFFAGRRRRQRVAGASMLVLIVVAVAAYFLYKLLFQ